MRSRSCSHIWSRVDLHADYLSVQLLELHMAAGATLLTFFSHRIATSGRNSEVRSMVAILFCSDHVL